MEFTVRQISNGWLINFTSLGMSALKEPYEPGEYFVSTLDDLLALVQRLRPF